MSLCFLIATLVGRRLAALHGLLASICLACPIKCVCTFLASVSDLSCQGHANVSSATPCHCSGVYATAWQRGIVSEPDVSHAEVSGLIDPRLAYVPALHGAQVCIAARLPPI